jgi:hypothetical protein
VVRTVHMVNHKNKIWKSFLQSSADDTPQACEYMIFWICRTSWGGEKEGRKEQRAVANASATLPSCIRLQRHQPKILAQAWWCFGWVLVNLNIPIYCLVKYEDSVSHAASLQPSGIAQIFLSHKSFFFFPALRAIVAGVPILNFPMFMPKYGD